MLRWELDAAPRLNWDRLRENKNNELQRLNQIYMKQIETAGIEFIEGRGKVLDPHTVEVNGKKITVRLSSWMYCKRLWIMDISGLSYSGVHAHLHCFRAVN